MLLDRKQFRWLLVTLIITAVCIVLFVLDAQQHEPSGSTTLGLTLGIAAFLLMVLLVGLALKRRVPHWRMGSAQLWLRGHLWGGLLIVLLVALHSSFKLGGPLTTWLWLLLSVVTVSGIFGLLLQRFVPSLLLHRVKGETVAQQLRRQIDALPQLAQHAIADHGDNEPLTQFYEEHARPYLAGSPAAVLNSPDRTESMFQSLRTMTPEPVHAAVDTLHQLCVRRRELQQQRFWMRLLHAWLILHVPLS